MIEFDMTWSHDQVEEKLKSLFPEAFSWLKVLHSRSPIHGSQWRLVCKEHSFYVDNVDKPTGRDVWQVCQRDRVKSLDRTVYIGN